MPSPLFSQPKPSRKAMVVSTLWSRPDDGSYHLEINKR